MNQFNYTDQPFQKLELDDKKRFRVKKCLCGKSNKDGKFVPYVGYEDKGYCHGCGKTFLPERPGQENWKSTSSAKPRIFSPKRLPDPPSFTPRSIFEKSLTDYDQNHFICFLKSRLGKETTEQLINLYHIGTSNCWKGSTVFWQIDIEGNIRAGKIMLYNPNNGKRVQKPFNHFNSIHSHLKLPGPKPEQCFFGEHLLKEKSKPVAIVESEKSAIIASVHLPEYIWLASGGLSHINQKKCNVLLGRKVMFFPDLGGYNTWQEIATELTGFANITVSDLLEKKATEEEKRQKLDIADYLIKSNHAFSLPESQAPEAPVTTQGTAPVHIVMVPTLDHSRVQETFIIPEPEETENWQQEIKEIENFFTKASYPPQPIELDQCSTICNPQLFIKSHLEYVKKYNGNRVFLPYLERLQKLKRKLNS